MSAGILGPHGEFLVAADSALGLIGRVEVVQGWDGPSALASLSVGGLAAHLGAQVLLVHAALTAGEGVTTQAPVSLMEHYERVPWMTSGPEDASNVAIREGAQSAAGPGQAALLAQIEQAVDALRLAFTAKRTVGMPPAIRMSWWDWSLSFEDFLTTRVMEIVVHSDDLAVSVGTPAPLLPEAVLGPVLALLVGLSLRRHGQADVVRALSRAERAPASISAF